MRVARMHEIAVGMAKPDDRMSWEKELKTEMGFPLDT